MQSSLARAPCAWAGADFVYKDLNGRLCGQRGASCYIEVKSQTNETIQDIFRLSANEWQLAQRCVHEADQTLTKAGCGDTDW